MNPTTLIRAIEQAKIALCQGDPKTGAMTAEQAAAFHELVAWKDWIQRENPTCDATIVRHVEDTGYRCGKKCAPGSFYCAEHQEN